MKLIFVDVEGKGPAPTLNNSDKFEWGAVEYVSRKTFHRIGATLENLRMFDKWLAQFGREVKFISDNPAYDWQFINYYFHLFLKRNPFGHSARRIGDFYAGLVGDFRASSKWKKLRVTTHDHHPVNDAMGNVEAFKRMMDGERVDKKPGGKILDTHDFMWHIVRIEHSGEDAKTTVDESIAAVRDSHHALRERVK